MITKAYAGFLLGAAVALASATAGGQSEIPSKAIQRFVIGARDQRCIVFFTQHPGPSPAVQPFEITKVSLADGPQYLVQGRGECFCSPTGNCTFWVVVPSVDSFRLLLRAGAIQIARVLPQMTSGHPDLDLSMHDSAFESTHWTYRFDGQRYRKVKCVGLSYQDAKNFDRILREPRMIPCQPGT